MRYSPDGNFWASGGFDGRIFIYEAKDSELIGEFNDESVKGKYACRSFQISNLKQGRGTDRRPFDTEQYYPVKQAFWTFKKTQGQKNSSRKKTRANS